jgi:hypothetical protein
MLHYGVRLAATYFHDRPGLCDFAANNSQRFIDKVSIAKLLRIAHF